MTAVEQAADATLDAIGRLEDGRFHQAEVFAKSGRSRRVEWELGRWHTLYSQEQGWAARAGDRRGSFFFAAQGLPNPDAAFPTADGPALELPAPLAAPPWQEPADLLNPLAGERDSLAMLEKLNTRLTRELPGARLLRAAVEDGASESSVLSSRGMQERWRQRLASLYVEAVGPRRSERVVRLYLAQREVRRFSPDAIARRLADLLLIHDRGEGKDRDRGEMLLAPAVGAKLLTALSPLFVGPQARERSEAFVDARGHLAAPQFVLRDNGRLPGGTLEAPFDGEGVPTRDLVIVENGALRQTLLPWNRLESPNQRPSGCCLRPGWRELPRLGPTHLYLQPSDTPVAELLGGISRGYYLLESDGPVSMDYQAGRFELPVLGFAMHSGNASAPISKVRLCGRITSLLRNLQAAGRDLTFFPGRGMIGSPTLLISGLELRGD
ncbi:MAG: metallopeptidase TldD-related protein [Acidobacteriota bacterium]